MQIIRLNIQYQSAIEDFCAQLISPIWASAQWLNNMDAPYASYACGNFDLSKKVVQMYGLMAWYMPPNVDFAELLMVQVLPNFMRQGVAHALWQATRPMNTTIYLEVRASNQNAKNLYHKWGFDVYGQRKNYYQNPLEDADLMSVFSKPF